MSFLNKTTLQWVKPPFTCISSFAVSLLPAMIHFLYLYNHDLTTVCHGSIRDLIQSHEVGPKQMWRARAARMKRATVVDIPKRFCDVAKLFANLGLNILGLFDLQQLLGLQDLWELCCVKTVTRSTGVGCYTRAALRCRGSERWINTWWSELQRFILPSAQHSSAKPVAVASTLELCGASRKGRDCIQAFLGIGLDLELSVHFASLKELQKMQARPMVVCTPKLSWLGDQKFSASVGLHIQHLHFFMRGLGATRQGARVWVRLLGWIMVDHVRLLMLLCGFVWTKQPPKKWNAFTSFHWHLETVFFAVQRVKRKVPEAPTWRGLWNSYSDRPDSPRELGKLHLRFFKII